MKKKKLLLGFSAICLVTFAAVSCGTKNDPVTPVDPTPGDKDDTTIVKDFTLRTSSSNNKFGVTPADNPIKFPSGFEGQIGYVMVDAITPSTGVAEYTYKTDAEGKKIINLSPVNGSFECLRPGKATVTVSTKAKGKQPKVEKTIDIIVEATTTSVGAHNFQDKSYEERAEITGLLEGWAMDNHLTGITLFQNGGYVLYNQRLKLGSDHYVPGFGYGNLSNGEITAPAPLLDQNSNEDYQWYYHTVLTTVPKDINYLNSQGEVVGDLYGYISAGLWNTKLKEDRSGYDWYNSLANGDLVAVNPDPTTGLATKFKVKVKTGKDDDLKYQTLSKNPRTVKFNNRNVELEDYVTAYKMLLTKSNNLSRGAELTSITSDGTLKGAAAYYNLTGDPNMSQKERDKLFDELVGIHVSKEEPNTIEFELAKPTSQFYAKYSLSNSLTMPIPMDFVNAIGGMQNYGASGEKDGSDVVDNILCLGPYLLEKFDNKNGGSIIFKLNEEFIDKKSSDPSVSSRYTIPGIYNSVKAGIKPTDLLNYFEKGTIDACGVPPDQLKKWIDKPECHRTEGDSTFKLNVNSTTQEEWDYFYKENFKKNQHAVSYKVKPIMSNDKFLKGLNESINRKEYAEIVGATPSQDYFGSAYLYDPEQGKSYNDTPYHQANLVTRFPETYGFNKEQAINDFRDAVNELVQTGKYTLPCKETITIHWMNVDDTKTYGLQLEKYIEDTFNDPAVSNGKFKLDVVNIDGTQNYEDVYSKHLQVGNFDLGFGSISGNALNPLNFLEVLKSDNSSGFTLNWGNRTDVVDNSLVYNGKTWSFDGLWTAANSGAVINNQGNLVKEPLKLSLQEIKLDADTKAYNVVIKWGIDAILASAKDTQLAIDKNSGITVTALLPKSATEDELVFVLIDAKDVTVNEKDKTISFVIPYNTANKEEADKLLKAQTIRFQVGYSLTINGKTSSNFFEKEFDKPNDFKGN